MEEVMSKVVSDFVAGKRGAALHSQTANLLHTHSQKKMAPKKQIKKSGLPKVKKSSGLSSRRIRGTENDPILQTEQFKKIVSFITVKGHIWSWPARTEPKWKLDPDVDDFQCLMPNARRH